jgi:hypothetical protein
LSKFTKALISLAMSVIFLLNSTLDIDLGVSEEAVSAFIVGITPILVYFFPNSK